MKLYPHQQQGLNETADKNRVAYYWDMGTGKTFVGSEKLNQLGGRVNLVVCQKSKIDDWINHFKQYYPEYIVCDLTAKPNPAKFKNDMLVFVADAFDNKMIGVINYELLFRRPELKKINYDTLMLDESSLIQNDTAKRTKFILSLKTENVILLSGTPTGGRYENLWSQLHLLGWEIPKSTYNSTFVNYRMQDVGGGMKIPIIMGYKNIGRLKRKMREYGCNFLKTDEVFTLPPQTFNDVSVPVTADYKKFRKNKVVELDDRTLIGDTSLTELLYCRQLCGAYNPEKLAALSDLLQSSNDRFIVFYNFDAERDALKAICKQSKRPVSEINGHVKDTSAFDKYDNAILLGQYQSASMGLNLQAANKIIYFTPPLSSELYEQSKKRTHRIGQEKPCFYYQLICKNSIEVDIYRTLSERRDYTERLFVKGEK